MRWMPAKFESRKILFQIDLEWFENTKLNCVKSGTRCLLQVGVRDWESLRTSPSRIQRALCETVAEVMDAEVEGEGENHLSKRPRVAERVVVHVPFEIELQTLDFDVSEFLWSSPNPVVASVFGDCEIIQRAAERRGYHELKSRYFELWR